MFTRDFIDRVRRAANLAELAAEVMDLKATGSQLYGRCPFHDDQTPSFTLNPDKGLFHCFGCGAGGDALDFYGRLSGQSFQETLLALAARYRVTTDGPGQPSSAPLLETLAAAADFFEEALAGEMGASARAYLERRLVPPEVVRAFRLGFAPAAGRACRDHLEARFGLEALIRSGLVRSSPSGAGAATDLFRDRIVFPICNGRGQVVGFGARALTDSSAPKYLNTPTTPVFKKSSCFFGLPQALPAIRKERKVVLVEGYFDVLAAAAASVLPALGLMSVSLGPRQVTALSRLAQDVVLLFDGDAAGRKASLSMAPFLLRSGLSVQVADLPEGSDPASFRETRGDAALQEACANAEDVLLSVLSKVRSASDLKEETASMGTLLTMLASVRDPGRRLVYIRRIARGLDLPAEEVLRLLPQA